MKIVSRIEVLDFAIFFEGLALCIGDEYHGWVGDNLTLFACSLTQVLLLVIVHDSMYRLSDSE